LVANNSEYVLVHFDPIHQSHDFIEHIRFSPPRLRLIVHRVGEVIDGEGSMSARGAAYLFA